MDRRLYLQSIAASSIAATAGCLDSLSNTLENGNTNQSDEQQHADNTVLKPPETDLSESSHPSYGDELPSLSLPDPLIDETISTDQFEGERAVLMTFIYTNCPDGMCPALTLRLRRTQEVAAENGFSDDVALLEMTFDPERDTESKLRTFADEQGVDAEADNWHFLRPETYDRAKTIMTEDIGLPFKKTDAPQYDHLEYMFPHYNLILLANKRGIVERAYPNGASIDPATVVDDVETVVTE